MPEQTMLLQSIEVRRLALDELVHRTRGDEVPPGLTEAAVRVVRSDRFDGQTERLIKGLGVRVWLDIEAFNFVADRIDHEWWEELMLQYFLLNQASTPMIQAMFPGTSRGDISRIRQQINAAPPGKPISLPSREVDEIYEAWRELSGSTPDLRERYFQLHERFGKYSLTTLFATLNVK